MQAMPLVPLLLSLLLLAPPAPAALLSFAELRIEGLSSEEERNARLHLGLSALLGRSELRRTQVEAAFRRGRREIQEALEPFGYYQAEVHGELIEEGERLRVLYRVERGSPVRVRSLELVVAGEGGEDPEIRALLAGFEPRVGEVFRHRAYEESKAAVVRMLRTRGYLGFRELAARAEVHPREGAVDVRIVWDSGPRHRFGEIAIEGGPLRPERVAALAPFRPGEPFLADRLSEYQRRLAAFDVWERIELDVDSEGDRAVADVRLRLAPGARDRFSAGLLIATDTGLGATASFERRWLNDRGDRLRAETELGQRRQLLGAALRRPGDRPLSLGELAALIERQDTDALESSRLALRAERHRALDRLEGGQVSLGLHLERERSEVAGREALFTLIYPALRFSTVRADDRILPTRGHSAALRLAAGSPAIGASVRFLRVELEGRLVRAVGREDRLLLRASGGRVFGASLEALPASLRFFAGGDLSVRGYDFRSLGERDPSGRVLGGRRLLTASAEWERMFAERVGAALFADAGNAFESRFRPARAAGLGLRYRSPLGPLRLDLARALDEPKGWRLHVRLGPEL